MQISGLTAAPNSSHSGSVLQGEPWQNIVFKKKSKIAHKVFFGIVFDEDGDFIKWIVS